MACPAHVDTATLKAIRPIAVPTSLGPRSAWENVKKPTRAAAATVLVPARRTRGVIRNGNDITGVRSSEANQGFSSGPSVPSDPAMTAVIVAPRSVAYAAGWRRATDQRSHVR